MVKVSARQVRSMRRDLYKTKHETKRIRKKAETTTVKLDIEKQTNSILRSSLKNFSGPFYKLKHRYNKLVRAYTQKKNGERPSKTRHRTVEHIAQATRREKALH